jgi:hypothetical protein
VTQALVLACSGYRPDVMIVTLRVDEKIQDENRMCNDRVMLETANDIRMVSALRNFFYTRVDEP